MNKSKIEKLENEINSDYYSTTLMFLTSFFLIGIILFIVKDIKTKKLIILKNEFEQELLKKIEEIENYEPMKKKTIDAKLMEYEISKKEKLEFELNNFVNTYLDDNYIERRDSVLLEQLEYTPIDYRYELSSEYKKKMKEYDDKEKEIIKRNEFVIGNIFIKKSEESKFEKMIVSGFNSLTDNVIQKVTTKNHSQQQKKINVIYDQFNTALELGSNNSNSTMQIGKRIMNLKKKKLELMLEYKLKIEEEKEIIKEEREKAKEEKKIQAILDKQIQKIEDEKIKISNQKEIYFERLNTETDKNIKEAILLELNKLSETIEQLNSEENSLSEKKNMTSSGYVYIISNIGSFGENIYKIGMTRREEPLDRVKELGDASVPFSFDVHALIYTTNAYELENKLHKEFANKKVNKVNSRKEFFNVSLDEIKECVLENYNGSVDFIETAEAIQYRETLLIDKTEKKYIMVS